ncbi:Uncharacterized membrane protein YvbJ [Atopostipes suicloacalis DSM 15692]|uniref:Uncharacterized membrane protein YvbJ n=1 Tax=Atopostipes suicloacalis DSM 15692 TaxID=1121025 RepID=A0A1M4X032_9LACT|nr:zinc-ribbon domain-containing protein [Atopostipes suicloacalis]SHE86834.1 Uncharacterized membrane protein YvbJ [Atopostipes suicloacalis DSM 15692]
MNYCESCGAKLPKDSKFCEECGAKVEQGEKKENKSPTNEQPTERKPLTKKQRLIGISILAIIIFLFAGYQVGSRVYSMENQTGRITEALASKDPEKIAKVVTTNDSNFEVNAKNLEGFAEYLDQNPTYLSDLINELEDRGTHGAFYIQKNGNRLFFFDGYDLVMVPVYGEVYTESKDVSIRLGDEELFTSDSENYTREVGPYAPGVLTFTAEGTVNGLPLTVTEEVTWLSDSYNEVDLTLTGSYFSVQSNLESGNVYIDGEKIGQLEDGYGEFGPIQIQDDMKLHVGQTFDDEDIIYDPVELTEETSYYEFYDLDLVTEYEAGELINGLYNAAYSLTSYDSQENEKAFNNYFDPEGPAYDDQRSTYLSAIEADRNNEDLSYVSYETTIDEIKRTGAEKFDVTYELTQRKSFTYGSDKEDELNHYSIEAAVRFKPTDHPDREYDSYIYEIYNEELLYEEGGESSASEDDSEDGEVQASRAVKSFVENLPDAVNNNNFSSISKYIDSSSAFYDEQSAFVTNTYERGITETLDHVEILETTLEDGSAQVKTSEAFTIVNEGSEKEMEYTAVYQLKKVDGDYLITSLSID